MKEITLRNIYDHILSTYISLSNRSELEIDLKTKWFFQCIASVLLIMYKFLQQEQNEKYNRNTSE